MRKLLFINPELQPGLQVTVRAGRKWLDVEFGELLSVRETGKEDREIAVVRVDGLAYASICTLPQAVLDLEHDSKCRDIIGLLAAMERAYPGFDPRNAVTVLFFSPIF